MRDQSAAVSLRKRKRISAPQWHRIYYLLVAFDVLVVLMGLTLNYQIVETYEESLAVNQEWVNRLYNFSQLGPLAGAVNAPGNDVFDTRDIEEESYKLQQALRAFDDRIATLETELRGRIGIDRQVIQS